MKFSTKTQRILTDERHDENSNGKGGAPGHITCFTWQRIVLSSCQKMVTQGGKITKAENLIHKAASVIKSDDSRERKRMRMEQIAEFMRDGQISVGDGTCLPLPSLVLQEEEATAVLVTNG